MYLKDIYESTTDEAVAMAAKRIASGMAAIGDKGVISAWVDGEVEKERSGAPSVLKGNSGNVSAHVIAFNNGEVDTIPDVRWGVSLKYVRTDVLRAGKMQNFSTRQVEDRVADGLMTMTQDQIVLHTTPELRYRILRRPGYFCCFDNAPMADAGAAQKYVKEKFIGKNSPDLNNPAGYRRDAFYACERID